MTKHPHHYEKCCNTLALTVHLNTAFKPGMPDWQIQAHMAAFRDYWQRDITYEELVTRLKAEAGFEGDLQRFGFYQFINKEDLHNA